MKAVIFRYSNNEWYPNVNEELKSKGSANLLLCFTSVNALSQPGIHEKIAKEFAQHEIIFCSTAGEIYNERVLDDSFTVAVLNFEKTTASTASVNIKDYASSYDAGVSLISKLPIQGLAHVLVLSDGSMVNGSELVKGLNKAVDNKIVITGGMAGDGNNFSKTMVGLNQQPEQGNIVAVGLYGNHIKVTHGSNGGWQTFGLEKEVTRSAGNKLFELDNKNALDMYKKYLGSEAENLPGSALMFPLSMLTTGSKQPVVRTILSVDNDENSMTFAGDIPEGSKVKFMKANFDMLTAAAAEAAQNAMLENNVHPDFSLLVSCVGRKIILGLRTEEEVEAVLETFGGNSPIAGFYSYGEIAPFNTGGDCQLHNQTMTITSFYEFP